jgi:hypothetical protein
MNDQPASCILFLDFDGVTHPDPCEVDELFLKLPLVEDVLRGFETCKIVISSSWRAVHPLNEMREYFAADMQPRVIGVTPENPRPRRRGGSSVLTPIYERQAECEAWLHNKQVWLPQNRRASAPWIAIDDRDYWFRPACRNLLLTNGQTGFTPEDAMRLEAMLRERLP